MLCLVLVSIFQPIAAVSVTSINNYLLTTDLRQPVRKDIRYRAVPASHFSLYLVYVQYL